MTLHLTSHPALEELALLASGDLPLLKKLLLRNHVRHCAHCEYEMEQFQATTGELKRQASSETLTGYESVTDWSCIEREMVGNINVGVAAARAISKTRWHALRGWSFGVLLSLLTLVFVAGWLLNLPREDTQRIATAFRTAWSGGAPIRGTVLQSSPHGVSVRSQGAVLTVLHPPSSSVTSSFSSSSSVGVRYVDDETGQVTITNVYGE